MDAVVHFEMPYDDAERVARVLSIDLRLGHAQSRRRDGRLRPRHDHRQRCQRADQGPGAINGGFFAKKADWPAQYPSVVIAVNDVAASSEKVRRAGGEVLGEPMEIPGVGRYVSFTDSEGNRVGMLQPVPRQA